MPKRVLTPLLLLNGVYLVMLFTVGPAYGWLTMVLIGAVVSAANIVAIQRTGSNRHDG